MTMTAERKSALVKEFATAKFNETVDCAVNLGIDASKSDQQVRGSTVMPHGTGKTLRVAVFTAGKNAELAKAAGADIVGMDDLAAQVKAGNINFDRVIASPDAMRVVGQLGQILGPRGLMPNPKVGTVTPDVAGAISCQRSAAAGRCSPSVTFDEMTSLMPARRSRSTAGAIFLTTVPAMIMRSAWRGVGRGMTPRRSKS